MSHEEFIRRIGKGKDIRRVLEITQESRQKAVGIGSECVVIPHEKDGSVVVAIHYNGLSKAGARMLYYQQRILSTLFPYNFVPFHMVYPSNKTHDAGISIRARIDGIGGSNLAYSPGMKASPLTNPDDAKAVHAAKEKEYEENRDKIRFPLQEALRGLQEIGFPFDPDDEHVVNKIIGTDGGEYYVDTSGFFTLARRLNAKRIVLAMAARGYSEEAQATVQKCIKRMKAVERDDE